MKNLIVLALLALAACAGGAPPRPAEDLANLRSVALPDYESDRGIGWASSREEYEAARADTRFVLQQFTYASDGLTVGAYLYRARDPGPGLAPVIVFNRGSYLRPHGFAGEMLVMAHRFAEAGFIVVAPQYRGSNGWAGRDELGGAELNDLMNLPREIARIRGADASRLFLAGESRGGAMVYMALRDGFPARAAAVWGAFTDLQALTEAGPLANAARAIWPQFETNRDELYRTRSALRWVDMINSPVLVMHGGADGDIPLSQSQRMDAELTRLGKVHDFIVFEGQQHVIGGRGAERDAATVAWFSKFDIAKKGG
jgi:dipeptidyl aminopeptidase/acylaminoacyl peptidase